MPLGYASCKYRRRGDTPPVSEKMLLAISIPPPARAVPLNGSFFWRGPIPATPISIMGSLHHNVCSASCEGNVEHCFLCKRINTVSGIREIIRPTAKKHLLDFFFFFFFKLAIHMKH